MHDLIFYLIYNFYILIFDIQSKINLIMAIKARDFVERYNQIIDLIGANQVIRSQD